MNKIIGLILTLASLFLGATSSFASESELVCSVGVKRNTYYNYRMKFNSGTNGSSHVTVDFTQTDSQLAYSGKILQSISWSRECTDKLIEKERAVQWTPGVGRLGDEDSGDSFACGAPGNYVVTFHIDYSDPKDIKGHIRTANDAVYFMICESLDK